jgi:hypothetical protein
MASSGLEGLAGTPLPEGVFVITAEEDAELRDVIGSARAAAGLAHPLWAYIATQRGIGISVADLCRLADFDVADGPMLGSTELEYLGTLRSGVAYRVAGEVLDVVRKHGRSGTFDVMRYRERLIDRAETVATATSTFILPRRNGA